MRKKLLTLLFALVAIVIHADTFTVGNFTYTTVSNTTTDVRCTGLSTAGANLTSITIPGHVTYGGKEYYVEGGGAGSTIGEQNYNLI